MTTVLMVVVVALQAVGLIGVVLIASRRRRRSVTSRDRALARDLRGALARGEIVPYYQPIVRASDGVVVGYEALARWVHPRLGVLSAGEFLAVADVLGQMATIDRLMLVAVATDMAELLPTLDPSVESFVTMNLSPSRLVQAGFADEVTSMFAESGLIGDGMIIELTEAVPVTDWSGLEANLERFHQVGIGLAVDDFGTGHADLRLLCRLDADLVKLDRSLVEMAMSTRRGSEIIASAIETARTTGAQIVAEGVSDARWASALAALGVDFLQGFAVGVPASMDDLAVGQAH